MQLSFSRISLLILTVFMSVATIAQPPTGTRPPTDSTRRTPPSATTGPKPYKEVITSKAVSDAGLFWVHKVEDKYYFEIPDAMIGRDILVVSRLSKAPADGVSYAGDAINQKTIRFDKGPKDKIFLKVMSFLETSIDSTGGMYKNVLNNNLQAIASAFDVKAYSKDSTGSVIDVTDYISGDNDVFFFSANSKRSLRLTGPSQADKSYIIGLKSFPTNIEIITVKSYTSTPAATGDGTDFPGAVATGRPLTFELNTSLVVLPKTPMQQRYFDDRVGYFTTQTITDYDLNPQGVDKYKFIARYRLEPKDADIEKYKRGELVEPKKQIVYYIDPTTPKKWVPYLIAGIDDWQIAFESAGFKNAIVGKVAPTYEQDSTFSLEDARHSAVIYKPSDVANASGPNIHDPRSGEIMESHVNWYHNIMSLVHDWYMVQTAAVDPAARKMEFDDTLMGELIRSVSSHEIGHTLGLRHNFGSSSTTPVEKLRDKAWVEANGHTASIMDYARFNYVAQPEDNISQIGLFPRIGDYDKWAIEWGYRWFPQAKTSDAEVALLNKWTIEKIESNKRLWWGDGESGREDPRSQTEDIGDNSMKASSYGIKNLQRIITNLPEWTKQTNKDFTGLATMYSQVTSQFGLYIGHVATNVGGIQRTPKRVEQNGSVFEFTPKATQKEAVSWIQSNVFTTPTWMIQKKITGLTGQTPLDMIGRIQNRALAGVINTTTINNLIRFEAEYPANAYTATELLNDVRKSVFSELATRKPIDIFRRQLQKSLTERLIGLITHPNAAQATQAAASGFSKTGDGVSLIKGQLRTLATEIRTASAAYPDAASKNHLIDLQERIKNALEPK